MFTLAGGTTPIAEALLAHARARVVLSANVTAVSAGASAIAGDGILASEPSNALSLPTWAVHVSSVTEWALAMKYVAGHAERTGNAKWKNLTLGMSPFLASGITACTFHAFYNPTSISALVPLSELICGGCWDGAAEESPPQLAYH